MRLADVAARVPRRAAFLGALFAALVTLPGLGLGTLWDNSETAYGEVAREILVYHDWLVMHLNGEPWFVQPPLYFWIAALFAKVFGVGAFAMRLPSALATVAMGGAVGYAAARIAGGRAGAYAAIILSTSLMQAIVGRLAIMDALLDLAVTAAILWWFRAFEPNRSPDALDARKRAAAFVCGAAALALGTLAKGPVAPVIVVLVVAAWLAWERLARSPVVAPRPAIVVVAGLAFAAVALPWFVLLAVHVGPGATGELIGHYTVGRYTGVIENQRGPWFYYLPVLVLGFFPWIAFVPMGIVRAIQVARTPGGSFARLALVWTVLPLLFFSFAQTKLPNYIALLFPALAIVVGMWFAQVSRGADRRPALISAATVPLTVGCIAFAIVMFGRSNQLAISAVGPQLVVLAAGMLVGSLLVVVSLARSPLRAAAPYILALTSLVLVYFIVFVGEPVAEGLKPIGPMAAIINAQRGPGDIVAIRGVSGGNGLVFYTAPGVRSIDPDDDGSFLRTVCAAGAAFVVTRRTDVPALEALAQRANRTMTTLDTNGRTVLIRVDGGPCPAVDPRPQ
ncbi:MAG: glycosyltransferase family 39 protein [Candidatus Velthaea sp.]|jgi:4-amino-4-deoxy-L-arabinose transferase-like glycosyltransferase